LYSSCIFCHNDLGANEVIEHFPIGRRLAFDASKGRLWVICRSCERWNLTPLEERWEAIEECERMFSSTTLRMSTEHIGLARVREGLELVRVGKPQRPEMAAWRYGDQFGRRRRRYYLIAGASAVAVGGLVSGYAALGLFAGGGASMFNLPIQASAAIRNRRIVARVPTPDGIVGVTRARLQHVKLIGDDSGWRLSIDYNPRRAKGAFKWYEYSGRSTKRTVILERDDTLPALAALLPAVNGKGGSRRSVESAVRLVEEAGDAAALVRKAASREGRSGWAPAANKLLKVPLEMRLALEMATHEAEERRALEGELAVLEARWKEAEEIAGISDNMFLPKSVNEWLRNFRA
jgi:hypothetical protein